MALSAYHGYTAVNFKTPAIVNADTLGTAVDVSAYKGLATFIANTSAATADTGVTPALTVSLLDAADTGDTFAATGYSFTAVAATAAVEAIVVDLADVKKYVKTKCDVTGSGTTYTGVSVVANLPS